MVDPVQTTTLDKIIEIATKASQALNIIAPGTGSLAGVGLEIVKYIAGLFNRENPENQVELPPDEELIDRLRQTSTRVVNDSEAFLHPPEPPSPVQQPRGGRDNT